MEELLAAIDNNPFCKECVAPFTKDRVMVSKDCLWGSPILRVNPSRLITAWIMSKDPLMTVAGEGYRNSEVRDKTFELQAEAQLIRGNRKLTKAKVSDALGTLKPTEDQTKIIAHILFVLKRVQTVCFNTETKSFWTVPEDFRAWSNLPTIWIDAPCENVLEVNPCLSKWISDRDEDGWTIDWPLAEGSYEELKAKIASVPSLQIREKLKKEDCARLVGKRESISHLLELN